MTINPAGGGNEFTLSKSGIVYTIAGTTPSVTEVVSSESGVGNGSLTGFVDGNTCTVNGEPVVFGSGGQGNGGGGSSGDPFVFPIYGEMYELPMKKTAFRMVQGEKLIMNASTRTITKPEGDEIQRYYKECTGKDAPKKLITEGVFYDKVFLKADGETMEYDFATQVGNFSSNYFTMKQETHTNKILNKCETSKYIQQIHISFNHSIYGNTRVTLNHYSNPQIKAGMGLQVSSTSGITGLLVREYKYKSFECRKLRNTKKMTGVVGKNRVLSIMK